MYLLSLYFQDPATLDFSPLEAGLATLPATVGLVVVAPLVPKLAAKFGGRQVDRASGSRSPRRASSSVGLADVRWKYAAFLLPLVAHRRRHGHVQRARVLGRHGVACRPTRSARRPESPTWRGTSAPRSPPPWPPRSTARVTANQTDDGRRSRRRARRRPGRGVVGDGRVQRPRRPDGSSSIAPAPGRATGTVGRRRRRPPPHTPHPADHGRRARHPFRVSTADPRPTMATSRPRPPVPFTTDDYAARMERVVADGRSAGLDGVLVTPGPDLVWLTGYQPTAITERLTMLFLTTDGEPTLLVPTLERPDAEAAEGAPATDAHRLAGRRGPVRRGEPRCSARTARYGVSDYAWAMHLLGLQAALPAVGVPLAHPAPAHAAGGQGRQRAGPARGGRRRRRRDVRARSSGSGSPDARRPTWRATWPTCCAASATSRSTSPSSARARTAPTRTTRPATG